MGVALGEWPGSGDGLMALLFIKSCAASQKAQMIHNAFVHQVQTIAITADELWSFMKKNKNIACQENLR